MKRGLPRPLTYIETTQSNPNGNSDDGYSWGPKYDNRRYPHPYTAQETSVAAIHKGRLRESTTFKLCGVCGEAVKDKIVGLILWNIEDPDSFQNDWLHSEAGPYHWTCLEITAKRCPHLAETSKFILGCADWSDVKERINAYSHNKDI